jgi:hypothetical protein
VFRKRLAPAEFIHANKLTRSKIKTNNKQQNKNKKPSKRKHIANQPQERGGGREKRSVGEERESSLDSGMKVGMEAGVVKY